MRPLRETPFAIPLLGALLTLAACLSSSAATCPTNTINCGFIETPSTAPSLSQSCSAGSASYDDINGQVISYALGGFAGSTAQDDFVVVGVPAGTSLSFSATLQVSSSNCCYRLTGGSNSGATIQLAGGSPVSANYHSGCRGCDFFSQNLTIPIATTAGTHFQISYQVSAYSLESGGGNSYIVGTLSFAGLPPGAIVSSCQGFRLDFPVATHPASWGRLKLLYR